MIVRDLVVVGGGPAGVGTAYQLRDSGLDVKVVEEQPDPGGRTKSLRLPGGMANTGALFAYRGTPSEELVAELGLDAVPFEPTTYGISVDGRTSIGASNADVVNGLPLPADDREALLATLDRAVAEYRDTTRGGRFTPQADHLDGETVAQRFRSLPAGARKVLETAVRGGSVGDTENLSARYALRYFASYPAHEQENRLFVLNGMQALTTGMAARLAPGTLDLSTRVTKVTFDNTTGVYAIAATGPAGDVEYRARQVLLAVPAPLVAPLVGDLPTWKREALARAKTPGSTTMVVAADVRGLEHHRDWAFVTTVGSRFDCIINPTPGRIKSRDEPDIVHFVCFGNSAGYQPDLPGNREREAEWLADFVAVAPDLRDRIVGTHVQTWEHCFALLSPERAAVVDELQQPVGAMHFAGDWTSPSAGTHGALGEAKRIADAVSAMAVVAER
ncbi:flavin monoamine oxidase family protein [Parasphingorhabdus pacifica]